jgi:hypothetical protein
LNNPYFRSNGRTFSDDYFERKGIGKAEGILKYLNAYYALKKNGLKTASKKMLK